jgi:hypothetical protein
MVIVKYLTIDELAELIAGSKRSILLLGHRIEVNADMVKELTTKRSTTLYFTNGVGKKAETIKLAVEEG